METPASLATSARVTFMGVSSFHFAIRINTENHQNIRKFRMIQSIYDCSISFLNRKSKNNFTRIAKFVDFS